MTLDQRIAYAILLVLSGAAIAVANLLLTGAP